ncbi:MULTISPECIES: restriction endonuclease subunit S [Pseudomonas fluorescens group]|uniref:HsdS protein n=1 Tax=Pseudomonas fluorescens TaxID=294 RepID=A0A0D0TN01_PSEFL|nr:MULTISPECIES: restriction endonuclease subunit S [Pseudomonas fluorescens group]AZE63381.1 Type I restriction-modification system, specificity subunit S [Pseudomonas synxantha]KIR22320.1 Type-1 restriction enzyme EcoKI specificity protein [Pseudomonas fluorescens]
MSHYKTYPAYKDSGVEWLGQVPEHWQVKRLKFIATVQTGVAKGKDNVGKDTIEVPYLRVANVQDGYLSLDDVTTIEIPRADLSRYSLCPGDVLMNEGGDFDKLGRGHVWQGEIEPCIHQNHVFAVRPAKVPPYWLNAFTGSQAAQFYFMGRSKQSTNLASISSSNVMELPIVVPPDDELSAVLTHLDRETVRIDGLIEKKTRFIELLREKRQTLITHAVTKGVDPNVKMKGSGVEWLGEVPGHWSKPMSLLSLAKHEQHSFVNGPFGSDLLTTELTTEGVPVVYIRDIRASAYRRVSEVCVSPNKAEQLRFCNVLPGDVIISKVGDPPGIAAVYPAGEQEGIVTQDVMRFRVDELQIEPAFMAMLINSDYGRFNISQISVESTRLRVGLGDFKQLKFTIPPVVEQRIILATLQPMLARVDALMDKTAVSVLLLKERRSALITAAVTGRIDLREAV